MCSKLLVVKMCTMWLPRFNSDWELVRVYMTLSLPTLHVCIYNESCPWSSRNEMWTRPCPDVLCSAGANLNGAIQISVVFYIYPCIAIFPGPFEIFRHRESIRTGANVLLQFESSYKKTKKLNKTGAFNESTSASTVRSALSKRSQVRTIVSGRWQFTWYQRWLRCLQVDRTVILKHTVTMSFTIETGFVFHRHPMQPAQKWKC